MRLFFFGGGHFSVIIQSLKKGHATSSCTLLAVGIVGE